MHIKPWWNKELSNVHESHPFTLRRQSPTSVIPWKCEFNKFMEKSSVQWKFLYPYPYPETSLTLGMPRDKPYHPGTLHLRRPPHGPGTYPIAQYTVYTSGGHHTAQGHTLLCSTLHTLQEATTRPKGPPHSPSSIPYLQEQSIPSNAQSYYETRLQISQPTQKSPVSKGYSEAYQQKNQQISKTTE